MIFPTLSETNILIQRFGMHLEPDEGGFIIIGWDAWRACRRGDASPRFDTVGHFWAEWSWYVAWTLENQRKNESFVRAFKAGDLKLRVRLLDSLFDYSSGKNRNVEQVFQGAAITIDGVPPDWPSELEKAIRAPNCGATFSGGHLFKVARELDPEAMAIHRENLRAFSSGSRESAPA